MEWSKLFITNNGFKQLASCMLLNRDDVYDIAKGDFIELSPFNGLYCHFTAST